MRTLEFILKILAGLIFTVGVISSYLFVVSVLIDYVIVNDILTYKIFDIVAVIFILAIYLWTAQKYSSYVLDIIKKKRLWKRKTSRSFKQNFH